MVKYIDAERLKTEIEALKRRKGFLPLGKAEITEAYMARGVQFTCDDIVNLIQSLQQEQSEVDLEKVLSGFIGRYAHENSGEYPSAIDIAHYFYDLRLNTRKEE